ncbi:DNA cytosine methyltransferase [Avibacterium paragallinarum]|uniref:Cytosine-specific methyltransferase n=1 Tax=Avibacterium paragallinarum TaxID=728 RepID=A0A377I8T1_AVIPA|nr:DNA cytosine methyltransferase [Avibacterium paragallinarum]KAA6208710.1 DNA cytosine methyltransferase [Avibacterium paragallinarum]POY47582.1 DNA (cytosine-5-)-methyltransferase [Avibacterium paragallinarum]RZN58138.1 DNA cytosine methyltransferase [Avibacterium paragallinarum]RZN59700.1 DNA cytosine methyltransferase [Avibacterium paragallinarum]RZN70398.1 DNA cytosine methyltransferase [Avibacterium paragallinarum]
MLKFIDLFAGIGGIRLGIEQVFNDARCVFSSEIDKYAIKTYQTNFGNEPVAGDITKINELEIPDHDLLLAGFPCQPFSQAGLKKGFSDTRGTLFFDIERILLAKKPQIFLLENVKQLKGHDNGNTLKIILEHLQLAGYKVYVDVLRARDFGIPQNRERVYLVGFLDHSLSFCFPKPLNRDTKVGDILEKEVDSKYTISDRLWAGHQRRKEENKKNGKGFGYGLFNHNSEYTNTISARYYKDGSEILIEQVGKNPRKLTPKEASRLQGFPENFIIPVSDAQAYKQFGNSVCVPVIKAIAMEIKNAICHIEKMHIKRNESFIAEKSISQLTLVSRKNLNQQLFLDF